MTNENEVTQSTEYMLFDLHIHEEEERQEESYRRGEDRQSHILADLEWAGELECWHDGGSEKEGDGLEMMIVVAMVMMGRRWWKWQ